MPKHAPLAAALAASLALALVAPDADAQRRGAARAPAGPTACGDFYAFANKDWLAEKAKEEGVMPLPKGIYYKVLASGKNDGKHPTPRSIVTAHYTGWTINGKKFDSSRSGAPVAFRLSDLIEGWIIAMQQMCVGDKWKVYIPSEMGYGKFSQPGIPGGSTLIFEIELFGIA